MENFLQKAQVVFDKDLWNFKQVMITRPVDKEKIKNAFSKAAATYEEWANVQNISEERLAAKIEGRNYSNILEIGCGTGRLTARLATLNPKAKITAIDLAPAMVKKAQGRLAAYDDERISLLKADGENLPEKILNKAPYDLIISSATFQWFADLKKALGVYSTILSQKGDIIFSVFGPSTLKELQTALVNAADRKTALISSLFPGKEELTALVTAVFGACQVEELLIKKEYDTLIELLSSLKYTGVAVPLKRRPLIRSRKGLARVEQEFLQRFGAIKVTYQIFFVTVSR